MRRLSNADGLSNMQNVANVQMRHVLTELLETERIYVNEISIILKVSRQFYNYEPDSLLLLSSSILLIQTGNAANVK